MFNVRLAGGHLYWKQLFVWLSLVVSLMASFVLSFFPLNGLDEIRDVIQSVSEGFLTYSRLTVSQASENSWSKMAVHACGTLGYFHYKITKVSAEVSAHGEFPAQREQYPNSFKYTSIFSLPVYLQKDI